MSLDVSIKGQNYRDCCVYILNGVTVKTVFTKLLLVSYILLW